MKKMSKIPWLKNDKLVVDEAGRPILCSECPCDRICEPKNLFSFVTSGRYEDMKIQDLSEWAVDEVGWPGGVWRLLETTDCYVYASGIINRDGRLEGLPEIFESQYHYWGRMILQQGCIDEFGAVQWPAGICDDFILEKKE